MGVNCLDKEKYLVYSIAVSHVGSLFSLVESFGACMQEDTNQPCQTYKKLPDNVLGAHFIGRRDHLAVMEETLKDG